MKKITFVFVICISLFCISQEQQNSSTNGRWVFGGDLSLGGGSNGGFGIVISPEIGYRYDNGLEIGGKIGYNYTKNDFVKSSFFNIGPYINYTIMQSFFARAQYQFLTGSQSLNQNIGVDTKTNINESALWLGGGYQNNIGGNVFYRLGLMYNVLYDKDNSIYNTGFYPMVGVSLGF